MATANLRIIQDRHTTQERARAAVEAHASKSNERTTAGSAPFSRVRHLNVDAVLARSLPKVAGE